jgi:hypothetical protein
MKVQGRGRAALLGGWDRPREAVERLPGQVGLFEYWPHAVDHGQGETVRYGSLSAGRRGARTADIMGR